MAPTKSSTRLAIGSTTWLTEERAAATQIIEQEAEEFSFSARNEMEWLNEHMADILSSENHINLTEIYKTPGKLRGKTPRTARKRNPLEARAPLTDIFSAGPGPAQQLTSILRPNLFSPPQPTFQIARDKIDASPVKQPPSRAVNFLDSGYHGSQHVQDSGIVVSNTPQHSRTPEQTSATPLATLAIKAPAFTASELCVPLAIVEDSFQSAKEELTIPISIDEQDADSEEESDKENRGEPTVVIHDDATDDARDDVAPGSPILGEAVENDTSAPQQDVSSSPMVSSPPSSVSSRGALTIEASVPTPIASKAIKETIGEDVDEAVVHQDESEAVEPHSPSDNSSPIRPIVRKSSLNFASLPAREPLTTKKSIGTRTSRTSHLDHTRTSYYPRQTGGKSIGGNAQDDEHDDEDTDINLEEPSSSVAQSFESSKAVMEHNKSSTQRLQDQISMLGKLQAPPRASKSIPGLAAVSQAKSVQADTVEQEEPQQSAPGAFPEDEDSWIGPSTATALQTADPSPEVSAIKDPLQDKPLQSPKRHATFESTSYLPPSSARKIKAASATMNISPQKLHEIGAELKKTLSASNDTTIRHESPSRSVHHSPLKSAKDKLSTMFKNSRGLFASSAAVSADARTEVTSPTRHRPISRVLDAEAQNLMASERAPLYPTLNTEITSPAPVRRTRASTEREEKAKAQELKEQRMMDEQLIKLEKLREKESKKARIFSQEEKLKATKLQAEQERQEQETVADLTTDLEGMRSTRSSPRKTKAQLEAEGRAAAEAENGQRDEEMTDTLAMPPPATYTSASGITKMALPGKRVAKPPLPVPKRGLRAAPAPIQIKVHTGARAPPQQPSNAILAAGLAESLGSGSNSSFTSSQSSARNGPPILNSKASNPSFNKSTGRKPAALLAAEKKREADEREAQRRLDLKLENQKKRAAEAEERKQEEVKVETEKKQTLRQQAATKKLEAQRQALERAKNERPPPPAARPSKLVEQESFEISHEKPLPLVPGSSRPASRMDTSRSQPATLNKLPNKRPLPHEADDHSRPTIQRNGPSYTQPAEKRLRTGEEYSEVEPAQQQRSHIGAPIRQSSIRPQQKDISVKNIYANSGYTSISGPSGPGMSQQAQRLAQAQAVKTNHPLDMAYTSKAQINFAPSASTIASSHKTPARTAVANASKVHPPPPPKSAKSSPRYQNGEQIDLPEINTDESDSESDSNNDNTPDPSKSKKGAFADWVDSPALRAGLLAQEAIDPMTVFGPPQELRMEEVFRNKERWSKFRQRTSSAVWTSGPGGDALSAEEVEADRIARERLQREGGWSYGLS